ncbi:MAG: guanylate kinase [Ruminococcaceae bacterium]|nr:guanylate kinase [Oscillospiraceae bacterium]
MSKRGKLLVLSGPSGCGKGTVLRALMDGREDMAFSVSATTRAPRPGEVDGREYYFVSRERFMEMVERGELLEHAEFVGNCYGTPKAPVLQQLEAGRHVLLDIEVQGAAQVKKAMPEAVLVFLAPPSLAELERRLRGRGTETEEKIQQRLKTAEYEMSLVGEYDYTVVNDVVTRAAAEVAAILEK